MNDIPLLKNVPLPISTLPTINFGMKTENSANTHLSAKGFTFSSPIEHDLSVSKLVPTAPLALPSMYDSFKFSNFTEHELPNQTKAKEKSSSLLWECSGSWVCNPENRISYLPCETPRTSKESSSGAATSTNASSAFATFQSSQTTFQFGNQSNGSTALTLGSTPGFVFSKSEAANTATTTSQSTGAAFGSFTNKFVFGSENKGGTVPMPTPASQATSGLTFGLPTSFTFNSKTNNSSAPQNPSFGSSAVPTASSFPTAFVNNPVAPTFEASDKPAARGFNFGVNSFAGFQFGVLNAAEKKRTTTALGFSFGAAATPDTSSSTFQSTFNMNPPPPGFGFRATSTKNIPAAGPFQFAASIAAKPSPAQNVSRKYKKALQRDRRE